MKVVHCKKEPFDIYIGRPSKWGNPFVVKAISKNETKRQAHLEAVQRYQEWIMTQPGLLADLHELKGKVLGCWCAPLPCHGDILLKLANKKEGGNG